MQEVEGNFSFNLQSVNLIRNNSAVRAAMLSLLPLTNFLFGNVSELDAIAEVSGWDDCSREDSTLRLCLLLSSQGGTVVITDGAGDTLVAQQSPTCSAGSPTLLHFPVKPVQGLIDTNGAGDAFAGGFLAAFATGATLADSVALGHSAAAGVCRCRGVPLSLPSLPARPAPHA